MFVPPCRLAPERTGADERFRQQYSKRYLEQLLPHAAVVPAVNQIENSPALPQQEIVDLCKDKGIHIMAYSPLGSTGGPLMQAEPVVKIAEKHGVKAATVLLSYHGMYTQSRCVLPRVGVED